MVTEKESGNQQNSSHLYERIEVCSQLNQDSTFIVYVFIQKTINSFQSNIKKSSSKFNPDLIFLVVYEFYPILLMS